MMMAVGGRVQGLYPVVAVKVPVFPCAADMYARQGTLRLMASVNARESAFTEYLE